MQNLRPERLHGRASLISGKHKPLYMMEGLDGSFGAAFLVSYHGSISAQTAILSHTYNPVGRLPRRAQRARRRRIRHQRARRASLRRADRARHRRRRDRRGDTAVLAAGECVVVKRSITRFAAESLHPEVACERIREGAARALDRIGQMGPPEIALPATLDVQLTTADYAELGTWLHGIERTGPRSLRIVDDEPLRLYKTWVTLIALTRCIREQE